MKNIYIEVTGSNIELIRFLTDNFELFCIRRQDKMVSAHNGFTLYFENEPGILERINKEMIWDPTQPTITIGE